MRLTRLLVPALCGLALVGCEKQSAPEGVITVERAETLHVAWSLPAEPGTSAAIAFSSDGSQLAVARRSSIELRDTKGALIGQLRVGTGEAIANARVVGLGASGGRWVVILDRGCLLLASGKLERTRRLAPCSEATTTTTMLALAPDGRTLARVTAPSGTLALGNLGKRQTSPTDTPLRGLEIVAWSSDGRWLIAAGSSGRIAFIDARRRQQVDVLSPHDGAIRALAWSPVSDDFASATETGPIVVWNVRESRSIQLEKSRVEARALAWSPDGKLLATAGENRELRIWDVDSRREVAALRARAPVSVLAWSPDGRALASYGWTGALEVWRPARTS